MPDLRAWRGAINGPGLATIAVILVLWEVAIDTGSVHYQYLPAPSEILVGFVELAVTGELWADTAHTLLAVLLGWGIASILGVTLGLLLGISPPLRRYCLASIEVLRPMPGIAFVPVALLLFGFSLETELVVIVLPALWPVLINTMGGVAGVHPRLFEVGATFRLPPLARVTRILIPAALPSILVGLRLSLTLALVLAVVAEMVGNPAGLGYAIVRDQQALAPTTMFANVVLVGLLGIILNEMLVRTAAALLPAARPRRES